VETALVLLILLASLVLFITEKFSVDIVAVSATAALLLFRLVTPEEAVSGLSNPATVTVAAMFVLGAALTKTDALRGPTRLLSRLAKNELAQLAVLIAISASFSAFINNTSVVATLLPVVLAISARQNTSASKLLIPLSYSAQFGGVCTLIGTSSNLLVSSISQQAGYGAFSMFELARLGILLLAVGLLYFVFIGRFLLPARRSAQLTDTYQLGEYITELRVMEKSPLTGKSLADSKFGQGHDIAVLEILRDHHKIFSPWDEPVREGDILLVRGRVQALMEIKEAQKLEIEPEFKLRDGILESGGMALVEIVLPRRSQLIGQTLAELDFRRRYNSIVLAMQRHGHTFREKLKAMHLEVGDALLLLGPKQQVADLRADDNFVVLNSVDEPSQRRRMMPVAVGIFGLVVGVAAFGWMPIMATSMLGCVAMVLTGCISMEEAYHAVEWKVVFLLAGLLPLGTAIEKSGAADFIALKGLPLFGNAYASLALTYFAAALLTEFMSHSAAAVIVAPIAIFGARRLGLNPKPFLIAVTFATSTTFSTPIGYHTNAMVHSAGGYKFTDFTKVGLPLNILFFVISVIGIPIFWPF
jgi:di/tricarboxylate transporter